MNHKVHLCIRGCFTLKLSLSWKTVICSPSAFSPFGFVFSSVWSFDLLPPSGEMGIVERSTGEEGFTSPLIGACAVAAAMIASV